jgi:4-methyl-5(b-hydroxyethyl)-thiazole monophosphate biosynthesis
MKRVLLLLTPGFEELEAIAPIDLLRRAGIEVVSAAVGPDALVTGSHGIRILADARFEDCLDLIYDMVILPGGPGANSLRKDDRVIRLLQRAHAQGIALAAICAAPLVLAEAGVARDRRLTSFPSVQSSMTGLIGAYSEDRVVVDGGIVTSRGAGIAEEFALALITYLIGSEAAETVRESILARPPLQKLL